MCHTTLVHMTVICCCVPCCMVGYSTGVTPTVEVSVWEVSTLYQTVPHVAQSPTCIVCTAMYFSCYIAPCYAGPHNCDLLLCPYWVVWCNAWEAEGKVSCQAICNLIWGQNSNKWLLVCSALFCISVWIWFSVCYSSCYASVKICSAATFFTTFVTDLCRQDCCWQTEHPRALSTHAYTLIIYTTCYTCVHHCCDLFEYKKSRTVSVNNTVSAANK